MSIVIVRGGGDLATGCVQKLFRSGFRVVVLETKYPTSIRRAVSLCEAVYDGAAEVEGIKCVRVNDVNDAIHTLTKGEVALLVDPQGETIAKIKPIAVVDAIIAKKNIGTHKKMAPITIGLGPGFCAPDDVDAVIETMRGHDLGRLIFSGKAKENTHTPGDISGITSDRVIYAKARGVIKNLKTIGQIVKKGDSLAVIENEEKNTSAYVSASISGVLRGLIRDGFFVEENLKIADIDPRISERNNFNTISDKARALGGAVLEAVLHLKREKNL